jgi:hypothetical protein
MSRTTAAQPSEVYVSGMSFDLQGWNGKYVREQDGSYVMKPYTLYGFISIIGTHIYFRNGKWNFQRDCDISPLCKNDCLEGYWAKGFFVSRHESHTKKILASTVLVMIGLLWICYTI